MIALNNRLAPVAFSDAGQRRVELALVLIVLLVAVVARFFSWPGFATHDTLFITQEALRGEYTSYHPPLNAFLIRVLAVPFESYSVYTTLQILLCCGLLLRSAVLLSRAVTRPSWIVAAVVLWAALPSTYLYLGVIWKDVLSAYSLLFIATLSLLFRLDREEQAGGWGDAILFGLSLFLLVGTRHGMSINFLLVPLAFGVRPLWAARGLKCAYLFALLGFIGLSAVASSPLMKNDDVHMMRLKISVVSHPFLGMVSNRSGYTSNDVGFDRRLADHVFGPEYAAKYRPDYQMNEVILTDLDELKDAYRAILRRTVRLCLLNVAQCGSDRVQMMLATLQPSTDFGGMTFYDLGLMQDCPKVFGMDADKCQVLDAFEAGEKASWTARMQKTVVTGLSDTRGTLQNLLVWNLIPVLALILLVLVFSPPMRPLWVVSMLLLLEMALPFATSVANDFRYYYFLAPMGAVLVMLVSGRLLVGSSFWRPAAADERGSPSAAAP